MVVFNSVEFVFEFVQLMVMGGEQRFGFSGMTMKVFSDTPSQTNPIVGTGSASNFVEKDKATVA